MGMTISFELSEVEEMALRYAAADPQEWMESFARHRASVAIEEIYQAEVARLTAEGADAIPTSREKLVLEAFKSGHVITAKQANEKMFEEMAKNVPPVN